LTTDERETRYRIGDWQFGPRLNRLSRGEETQELEPLASRLLELLASHPRQVFSADELVESVWEGRIVSDNPIYKLIATLRRALDDNPSEPRYIETIRKRGYRLVAPVERLDAVDTDSPAAPVAPPPRRLARLLPAVSLLAAVAILAVFLLQQNTAPQMTDAPVIAVLPFDDMSEMGDQAYLGNGIAEEIIHALAEQQRFGVVGRTSAFAVSKVEGDLRRIGELLGATHVVEGSVRMSDETFRITAQLIEAKSGLHAWSGNFDRPKDQLLDMQAELAQQILDAIADAIDARPVDTLPAPRSSALSAYEHYLRGRHRLSMRGAEAAADAEIAFLDALAIDPDLVQAMEGLIETQFVLSFHGAKPNAEAYELAAMYGERALAIAPQRAEVHAQLGRLAELGGRTGDAEAAYRTALEFDPRNSEALGALAWLLYIQLRADEALPIFDRAMEVEPASPLLTVAASLFSEQLGDYQCAESLAVRAAKLAPSMQNAHWVIGNSLWHFRKDTNGAIARMIKAAEIDPDSANPPSFITLIALEAGDTETASKWLLKPDDTGYTGYWPSLARLSYGLQTDAQELALSAARLLSSFSSDTMALRTLRDNAISEGKPDDAIALYPETLRQAEPEITGQNIRLAADLAVAYAAAGNAERANLLASRVLAETSRLPRNAWTGYWLADVIAITLLDGPEAGLERLEVAIESGWHLMDWWELDRNVALAGLRQLPRYESVVVPLKATPRERMPNESRPGRTLAFCDRLD